MYIDDKTVNQIVEFLIVHFNPYVIYLFGSVVNGNFRIDSDIDIAFKDYAILNEERAVI